mgnify:CR=1 FL=1
MFMKIFLKVIGGILGIIVVLGIVFFVVDYNRVKNQEKPIFCIQNTAGMLADGGTIEYFGLGYKVIDFHTIAGFDDIKIGTWFMDYNDFEEEIKEYLEHFITNILYDLSYKNVLSDLDEDDLDILEMKKDLATKWFEAYERANNILNPNIDIKKTKEDLSWLIDRIKTSLKQYLLNIPDLKNSKEFIENTFINDIEISFPLSFYDEWENGEVAYWFLHSGAVIIQ